MWMYLLGGGAASTHPPWQTADGSTHRGTWSAGTFPVTSDLMLGPFLLLKLLLAT